MRENHFYLYILKSKNKVEKIIKKQAKIFIDFYARVKSKITKIVANSTKKPHKSIKYAKDRRKNILNRVITEGSRMINYFHRRTKGVTKMTDTYEKFLIYTEEFDIVQDFSDREIGVLLRALIHFAKTGEEKELNSKIRYVFKFMASHMKRDRESYNNMIEKKRASGKKGAEARYGKKTYETESKENPKTEESKKDFEEKNTSKHEEKQTKETYYSKDTKPKEAVDSKELSLKEKDRNEASPKEKDTNELSSNEEINVKNATEIEKPVILKDSAALKRENDIKYLNSIIEARESQKSQKEGGFNKISSIDVPEPYFPADFGNYNSKANSSTPADETRLNAQFDEFWEHYPKKHDRESARASYFALCPSEDTHKTIIDSLKKQRKTEEWERENGRFIPHPSRWLNGKRWEDKISQSNIHDDSFDVDEFYKAALRKSTKDYVI